MCPALRQISKHDGCAFALHNNLGSTARLGLMFQLLKFEPISFFITNSTLKIKYTSCCRNHHCRTTRQEGAGAEASLAEVSLSVSKATPNGHWACVSDTEAAKLKTHFRQFK
jgi:hypothetical protein